MSDKTSVFRFKKFSIIQKNGVFKVNTDACLLGAYTARFLERATCLASTDNQYLDIGTGTGVIPCMLAQTTQAQVTGIDINKAAVKVASENFKASIWSQRIHAELVDVLQLETQLPFNIITCNPPYFTNSLKSPDSAKNLSRHNDGLSPQNLLRKVGELLDDNGCFFVIYPPAEAKVLAEYARRQTLYLQELVQIRPLPSKAIHRILMRFGKKRAKTIEYKELLIEKQYGEYSENYKDLLKNFYTKL